MPTDRKKSPGRDGKAADIMMEMMRRNEEEEAEKYDSGKKIYMLPLDEARPNPSQPRKEFDDAALEGLAESIRENGVIQPIVVADSPDGGYFIVAGERRAKAARIAGLEAIPAVKSGVGEDGMLQAALIENLQREDLNAIEVADAIAELSFRCGLPQAEIARKVGKSREWVGNKLRLAKGSEKLRGMVLSGELEEGKARALLSLDEESQDKALSEIRPGASTREVERIARKYGPKRRNSELSGETEELAYAARSMLEAEHPGAKLTVAGNSLKISLKDEEGLRAVLRRLLQADPSK